MDFLEGETRTLKEKAWASSTMSTYKAQLNCYIDFCAKVNKESVPVGAETVQLYVTYLVRVRQFTYASVRQYLNVLTQLHRFEGLPDPIPNNVQLQHLLRGVKRDLGVAQTPVDAISPSVLLSIRATLNLSVTDDLCFWCACLVAFYGLLRPINITCTSHDRTKDLCRSDVIPCSWGYLLVLRRTKTVQFREHTVSVCLPRVNHELCPVTALHALLVATNHADPLGPLFLLSNGHCLSYSVFRQRLSAALSNAGIQNHCIKGHSFRRGGATWLSKLGVAVDDIKSIGLWASGAVNRYIEPGFERKLAIMQKFGSSLLRLC